MNTSEACDRPTHVVIPMPGHLGYVQRLEPPTASENPLRLEERLILHLWDQVQAAERRAAWAELLWKRDVTVHHCVEGIFIMWHDGKAGNGIASHLCNLDANGLPVETPELRAQLEGTVKK